MRKATGTVLAFVLTAAAMGATGLGPASSQEPGPETFTLCAQEQSGFDRSIDVGKRDFSPGDYTVSVKPLLDPETGDRKGQLVSTFTFVKPIGKNDGRGYVEGTYELETGKITFYGSFKFSDEAVVFAITGGNGAYSNVGGTVSDSSGRCDGERGGLFQFEVIHD
ncbi:MAG TPA: hypothetical protein VNC78_04480 [Actinomycetota bacterium]|nr:hypothetical protein [Actinomycetota bacterium]